MELFFDKATLKTAIAAAKSVAKTKASDHEKRKAYIYIDPGEKATVRAMTLDKGFEYLQKVPYLEPVHSKLLITFNPYTFDDMFKGMGKIKIAEISIDVDNRKLTMNEKEMDITILKGDAPDLDLEYKVVNHEELIDKTFLINDSMGKTTETIILGGRSITSFAPTYSKRVHMNVDLESREIKPNHLSAFKMNLKIRKADIKSIETFESSDKLILRYVGSGKIEETTIEQYFVFKSAIGTDSERKSLDEVKINSFQVDPMELLSIAKSYKAVVPEAYFYEIQSGSDIGRVNIDPYEKDSNFRSENEEFEESYTIKIEGDITNLGEFKVYLEGLKSLLTGYEDIVTVDVEKFTQKGDSCHMFTIKTPEMSSSLVLKNKPDYEDAQKRLDAIIKRQSTYRYLT